MRNLEETVDVKTLSKMSIGCECWGHKVELRFCSFLGCIHFITPITEKWINLNTSFKNLIELLYFEEKYNYIKLTKRPTTAADPDWFIRFVQTCQIF